MEFRPTLVIGLGGSGTFVARRLKKRLFRLVESDIPPSIQLLAFDTDRQSPHPLLDELSPHEFNYVSDFQGDNFVSRDALSRQPALKEWWKYSRLAPGFVRDGAKQKPPVGRLAFFVKFDSIEKTILDCVQRMFQKTPRYTPPPNVNSVDLYVIGSSCGGTGSGMFFDVAVLARDLIGKAGREAVLQSHVFLPSCFEHTSADRRSLQTNSFAFFKTMETMQSDSLPPVKYPRRAINSAAKSLFSRVHLLSSVNTAGVSVEDAQDIFETAALQLDLEISGASGRNMKSAIDNAAPNFDVRPEGRLAIYSSYGSASLTGTPDFGRLAVLPDFVRSITASLNAPFERQSEGIAVTNPGFVQLDAVLNDESAALGLLTGYESLVLKIKNTDEPARLATELRSNLDSILARLSTDGLSSLGSLGTDVRDKASKLIENGDAGISRAIGFLESVRDELDRMIKIARAAESAESESVGAIVGKLDSFFKSKDWKKTELVSKALPYLRTQSLAMVRRTFSLKTKATLSTAVGEVNTCLVNLRRFGDSANALAGIAEKESKDKIAAKTNILGAQSVAIDIEEVKKSFAKKSSSLVTTFFTSASSSRSLRRLAEGILAGKGSDDWGGILLQTSDEYLRTNLAADAAVPSNWYDQAANQIIECQPLVQFVAEHEKYGAAEPIKVAVARVYAKDGVESAVKSKDPLLNVQVGDSSEPGSLEVTTVVLNFGLYQLQELRMIEEGFNEWKRAQPESSENRYAWRGPEPFWRRLLQTGIFPLTPDKQALARLLAFYPVPPGNPVATQKTETYSINGRNLELDSDSSRCQKYRAFNGELLGTGLGESLLQSWTDADPVSAKLHAESLVATLEVRIAGASAREDMESDWLDFVEMLREELNSLRDALRRLPV